jgi:hypothetical protein
MSTPGDLGFLRVALFAQLENRTKPLAIEEGRPERAWLEWLGVPLTAGPCHLVAEPLGLDAADLRAAGILPEVVYSCLVQTWWHPQQTEWVARTRSEIYACYESAQVEKPGWTLTLEALEKVNAYRLQELTPHELMEASREFWNGSCLETERMEGWLLLHLDRLERLHDVADCLFPFLFQGEPRGVLSDEEARQWLRIPEEVAFSDAAQILGPERVARLLGERSFS